MSLEISKQFPIQKEMLSGEHYVQSLLHHASRLGIITPQQTEQLQLQTAQLLQKQLIRFTHGESSSVKTQTAQGILLSLLFTVSLALKDMTEIEAQLKALTEEALESLHTRGREILKVKVLRAKGLLNAVKHSRVSTENEAYNQTVDTAIPGFFAMYDLYYAAHGLPCMIDYPLAIEVTDRAGIEFIEEYLQRLAWENAFCVQFPTEELTQLLTGYHSDFNELLENITLLTLSNALGSILLGKGSDNITLTGEDITLLMGRLAGLTSEEFARQMEIAKTQLPLIRGAEDYLNQCADRIIVRIDAARQGLGPLPLITAKPAGAVALLFSDQERMDDEHFCSLTEELRSCRDTQDKLLLVRREVNSFGDLTDILGAECFFGQEYEQLFGSLKDFELVLLYKTVPREEDGTLHRTEAEKEWQQALCSYIDSLDVIHRNTIEALAAQIAAG
ncbi:DUF6179 domain-containing protein [Acetanaerobacterium elongatum]|uniref:Uncharacterized protein n=1 Tax=Acetanaerobacterium elongatum TaxID=258515 RepID=A0A1G9UQM5_9FIRM|nr:DUF6179 domain-containing protein [Acetanaerobacterium elongatum]SDM62176.1 hypothetical protein SAMN05192585_10291 [Acetanaerobacterium elongatum]